MNREYGLDSDEIELGVSERVLTCPKCGKKTYLYLPDQDVSKCENCDFEYSYINCSMCSTTLESYELDDAENNRGLCSYCLYKMHKIEKEIFMLDNSPYICMEVHIKPRNKMYRRLIVENYIVLYRVIEEKKQVVIFHILYGGRNYLE